MDSAADEKLQPQQRFRAPAGSIESRRRATQELVVLNKCGLTPVGDRHILALYGSLPSHEAAEGKFLKGGRCSCATWKIKPGGLARTLQ